MSAGNAGYAKEWLRKSGDRTPGRNELPIIKQTQRSDVDGFIVNFFKRLRLRTKSLLTRWPAPATRRAKASPHTSGLTQTEPELLGLGRAHLPPRFGLPGRHCHGTYSWKQADPLPSPLIPSNRVHGVRRPHRPEPTPATVQTPNRRPNPSVRRQRRSLGAIPCRTQKLPSGIEAKHLV